MKSGQKPSNNKLYTSKSLHFLSNTPGGGVDESRKTPYGGPLFWPGSGVSFPKAVVCPFIYVPALIWEYSVSQLTA